MHQRVNILSLSGSQNSSPVLSLHLLFSVLVKAPSVIYPQGRLVYTTWLILSENAHTFKLLFLLMVAEAGFPSHILPLACRHLRADTELWRDGARQCRASPELSILGAFPLERALPYPRPPFSLNFSVASSDISETGQSWQLLHCASGEIFWGPINSQPLQLAGGRPGNK